MTDKFNIYSYINSRAIAGHCQKIGHKFSPSQQACIADCSERHTITEKHEMFCHILDTMPDDELKMYGDSGIERVKLSEVLPKYMSIREREMNDFYTPDSDSVYKCDAYFSNAPQFPSEYGPHRTISEVFAEIDDKSEGLGAITVQKINLSTKKETTIVLNSVKEPIFFYPDCSGEEHNITQLFDLMWFVCPAPFKKGDIVCFRPFPLLDYTEPFILENICYEGQDDRYFKTREKIGGCMDMTAYGYFQTEDGNLYWECMHDYMSLEYYDGELDGKKRILKVVSGYMKGKIPIDLMLEAYKIILDEERLRKERKHLNFIEKVLIDAGLEGEK